MNEVRQAVVVIHGVGERLPSTFARFSDTAFAPDDDDKPTCLGGPETVAPRLRACMHLTSTSVLWPTSALAAAPRVQPVPHPRVGQP